MALYGGFIQKNNSGKFMGRRVGHRRCLIMQNTMQAKSAPSGAVERCLVIEVDIYVEPRKGSVMVKNVLFLVLTEGDIQL